MANSALSVRTALVWFRIAAISRIVGFCVLIHFIMVLTEHEYFSQKRWVKYLLYLPVLVFVTAFAFNNDLAVAASNLKRTNLGWTIVSLNRPWDWFLNTICFSYLLIGVARIFAWGRKASDEKTKRIARLLTAAGLFCLVLLSTTDMVLLMYSPVPIPAMAPLLTIIPTAAVVYSIRRYDFMMPATKSQSIVEGKILNEFNRSLLFSHISFAYIAGSAINIIANYFFAHDLLDRVLLFNLFLIFCGLLIQLVNIMSIEEEKKEWVVFVVISLSMPAVSFHFIESAGVTVWALPAIGLALSVVFENRRLLLLLSACILTAQVWVWYQKPLSFVQVGAEDHVTRIFIFLVLIILTFRTNRIFVYRLKENENQAKIQKMILNISAEFVNVSEDNIDGIIENMLRLSGEQHQVDRTFLLLFSQDHRTMTYSHEWCAQGIEAFIGLVGEVSLDDHGRPLKEILAGQKVLIPDVDLLPPSPEKDVLKKAQVRSLITFPVTNKEKVLGCLGFASVRELKTWREDHQESLEVLVNILADALVRVAAEKEIKHLAFHDALTGLPNRAFFIKQLKTQIDLAKETGNLVALVMVDVDSFKKVNDTLGHDGGDEVLRQVALKLHNCVDEEKNVARFGGDEFLIMLSDIVDVKEIARIVERVLESFQQPLTYREHKLSVTVSAGIALFPMDGEEPDTLIKNADLALYSAKAQGKNTYRFCSSSLKAEFMRVMWMTNSLNKAKERNELVLHYQPQVDTFTKKVTGLEALIRWEHPEMGIIYPGTFIPLAEQTGLIHSIGEWVLMTACRQSVAWQKLGMPPIQMAVNLSAKQLRDSRVVEVVSRVLNETGLSPEYLELEITESASVKESDTVIPVLNELKKLGVSVAIDDFGTGYSSLSRLNRLPIDRIKIGMQFIHAITNNQKDETIVRVIIQLAKSLNLRVIAEGVETEEQLAFLENEGCHEVQGNYFYKPMSAEEIESQVFSQYTLVT